MQRIFSYKRRFNKEHFYFTVRYLIQWFTIYSSSTARIMFCQCPGLNFVSICPYLLYCIVLYGDYIIILLYYFEADKKKTDRLNSKYDVTSFLSLHTIKKIIVIQIL